MASLTPQAVPESDALREWASQHSSKLCLGSAPAKVGDASNVSTAVPSPSTSWNDEEECDFVDLVDTLEAPPGLDAPDAEAQACLNAQLVHKNEQLRLQAEAQRLRLVHENTLLRQQVANATSALRRILPLGFRAPRGVAGGAATQAPLKEISSHQDAQPEAAAKADGKGSDSALPERERTTVMLRHLPSSLTRDGLVELLRAHGFEGAFDFVYLPYDFKSHASLGYSFVNLTSPEEAQRFWQAFDGFADWGVPCSAAGSVCWSSMMQGYEAHVEKFRNSPVMHQAVPEEHRPLIFKSGVQVPFPGPTKKVKAPRVRPGRSSDAVDH